MSGYINQRWSHRPTQEANLYREPDNQIKGLGDVVQQVARVTGVEKVTKVIERVTKRSCGCAGRRERLNRAFPLTPRGRRNGN